MIDNYRTILLLLFSIYNLFSLAIDFEDAEEGQPINEALSNISVENLDNIFLKGVVSGVKSSRGELSLYIADKSSDSKPIVSVDLEEGQSSYGTIRVYCYVPTGNERAVYIALSDGRESSDLFFEIKIKRTGEVLYEDGQEDPTIKIVSLNEWHYYDFVWVNGKYCFYIDDELLLVNRSVLDSRITPSMLLLYVGDNSYDSTEAYFDDIYTNLF